MYPGCCETLNSRTKTKDKRVNTKPRPIAITKTKQTRHRWSQNGQRKPCLEPFSCHRDRYVIFTASLSFPLTSDSFFSGVVREILHLNFTTMCHSATTSGCCPGSPRPHKKSYLGSRYLGSLVRFFFCDDLSSSQNLSCYLRLLSRMKIY